MVRKIDADEIADFMDRLAQADWLGPSRRDWPRTIYHYSEVCNVADILRSGYVRSRARLVSLGISTTEIANTDIIGSSPWTHALARFYFRPRTPTQYKIEGIRPRGADGRPPSPHCAVPVFLLFDARRMLTRNDCVYTDGNFASKFAQVGEDAKFLRCLDFRNIYHDSAFPPEARDVIVHSRCAEVLFPTEVDISDLTAVVCRTPAERTTLLVLLEDERERWADRVRVEQPGERLFFRRGSYAMEARLSGDIVILSLRLEPGAVHDCEALVRLKSGEEYRYALPAPVQSDLRFRLPNGIAPERVYAEVYLSGSLAYKGYPSQRTLF